MQEHKYIKELIIDRWWSELEQRVHPLQNEARRTLCEGKYEQAIAIENQVARLLQQLMDERMAAEKRLHWLEMDAKLRTEGKTYPDVYDSC